MSDFRSPSGVSDPTLHVEHFKNERMKCGFQRIVGFSSKIARKKKNMGSKQNRKNTPNMVLDFIQWQKKGGGSFFLFLFFFYKKLNPFLIIIIFIPKSIPKGKNVVNDDRIFGPC